MDLDPDDQPDAVYRTLSSLVVPRPIGWISTVDSSGTDNLAPFSYFNAISNDPPTVMFSAGDRNGNRKDTPRNALETEEFVANLVTDDLVEGMDRTSADTDESEFDAAGIERAPSKTVSPPRVANALASLECTLVGSTRVGDNTVVFGEVELFRIDESILTDGAVDSKEISAVGRLGGPFYTRSERMNFTRQQ